MFDETNILNNDQIRDMLKKGQLSTIEIGHIYTKSSMYGLY